MSFKIRFSLRIFHIIGLTLGFISLFVDWYYFQAANGASELYIDWAYHLFMGWYSPTELDNSIHNEFRPITGEIPIYITVLFIIFLAFSVYTVCIKDAESSTLSPLGTYAFSNLGYILILVFYVLIFPILYLLPNGEHWSASWGVYPYVLWNNSNLNFICIVGPGYFLQMCALMCSIPYTLNYYHIIRTYEEESSINSLQSKLKEIQTDLDLDKLIAEEEIALKLLSETPEEDMIGQVYQQFLLNKKRRRR